MSTWKRCDSLARTERRAKARVRLLKQRALSFTSFSVGGKISRQPQGIVATREALPIIACDRIMQYPLI